ncbi:hypothetical protein B6V74_18490 [Thioclava sp. F42-5]|uniref:sulfotransferase family protein n=1 Tax=Thioclava sp. F42-5 TaxID=1973005 RepID=UPI000B54044D|nr:sulfotransferase [Thioclava sp. F42-5]OWY07401.1 hypothetical protein B6V74_18490 [Thioclava sp. F42-5]
MDVPTNLFLIGAPKCGTTSLVSWMAQHPEIYSPKPKEPHFFYSPTRQRFSEIEYLRLYRGAPSKAKYVCDASTSYLFGGAYKEILREVPSARFVVCIRDPVEMLSSMYNEQKKSGFELADDLRSAWQASDARWAGEHRLLNNVEVVDPRFFSLKHTCALGWQLDDLLNYAGKDRVYIVLLDDMRNDPQGVFRSLCRWLDISSEQEINYQKKNSATRNRSETIAKILRTARRIKRAVGFERSMGILRWIARLNEEDTTHPQLEEGLFDEAKSYFKSDLQIRNQVLRDLGTQRAHANVENYNT